MKKKYAKIKLIVIAVLVVIGLCLTVFSFDIPTTSNKFLGFIGAIKTSTELDNSYKIEFTVDREEGKITNTEINSGVQEMYDIFTNFISSYNDVRVTRATKDGNEMLVAYVPATELGSSFFSLFGESKKLEVKYNDEVILTNSNIKAASYTSDGSNYGVYIEFDKQGTRKLIEYSGKSSSSITYYIDDTSVTGRVYNTSYVFLTDSSMGSSANTASTTAIELLAGKLPYKLTVSLNTTVDAMAGENVKTLLKISTGIFALLYVAYMIYRHRLLGLVSLISGGIFVVADTFIIQSIPVMSLTLASYFAILIAFITFALSIEYQISKMEAQYVIGKRIPVCIKQGYQNSLLTIMDVHFVGLILAIAVWAMGTRIIKAVAIAFMPGIIISSILALLINKYFVKLLADIYPQQSKAFNFKREDTVDEI